MSYIHREGYASLALVGLVLAALNLVSGYYFPQAEMANNIMAVVSVMLFLIVLQFFRNPGRAASATDRQVIAPADGKVVVIEEVDEPEVIKGRCLQVSIFMSPINVHVNRSPVTGTVEYFKYHPGKYLVAWHPKSSEENERTTLSIRTKDGDRVMLRQIAGALARRIVCYARPGNALTHGQEFGFIKFGSRVDVFLPLGSKVLVNLGDRPRGGETVLAELP